MVRNHVTKVASTHKKKALLAVDLGVAIVERGQLEYDHGLLLLIPVDAYDDDVARLGSD